jgi:hypothetical protein
VAVSLVEARHVQSVAGPPAWALSDRIVVTAPEQLWAPADPLCATILDLLLEHAATVAERAAAVQRPKVTVAHLRERPGGGGDAARRA